LKLDLLVRIEGFHLRAGAGTSPGMDRDDTRETHRAVRGQQGNEAVRCPTVIRHRVHWAGRRPADRRPPRPRPAKSASIIIHVGASGTAATPMKSGSTPASHACCLVGRDI
jgi:hypothetical protein